MTPAWLTVDQVAALTQLSVKTVYRHLESGQLRGSKVGAAWRVRREDADEWMDSLVPTHSERPKASAPRRRPSERGSLLAVLDGGGTAA